MHKLKVVIVGGGFGGLKAALQLANDKRLRVTLISDTTDFNYYPTLYRTATGGSNVISAIPISEVFEGKNIHLLNDKVVDISKHERVIKTKVGHHVGYDALILALGVRTNYFRIKGLATYSYGIRTIKEAIEFKNHVHGDMIDDQRPDLNYVIVGAGPSGVELAGALPAYLKRIAKQHNMGHKTFHVDLVETTPRVLPKMTKDISRRVRRRLHKNGVVVKTNSHVEAQSADAIFVNGKPIRSHTVVWTAGIKNNPFFSSHGFQLAHNGRVRVDQYLQAEPGIYVIGDNADTPYSGLAQTALYDAKFVARNIKRLLVKKRPRTYIAKMPVIVVPVGPNWAALEWRGIKFTGRTGWVLRRLADLLAYHDYQPWKLATKRWSEAKTDDNQCSMCVKLPDTAR